MVFISGIKTNYNMDSKTTSLLMKLKDNTILDLNKKNNMLINELNKKRREIKEQSVMIELLTKQNEELRKKHSVTKKIIKKIKKQLKKKL